LSSSTTAGKTAGKERVRSCRMMGMWYWSLKMVGEKV
jgi:hypothetical protein